MKQTSHAVRTKRPWLTWLVLVGVAVVAIVTAGVVLLPDSGLLSATSGPAAATDGGSDADSDAPATAAVLLPAGPKTFVTQPGFQPGDTPPCIVHQTALPNGSYQDANGTGSADQLTFVSYYTAAGQLPFCDGRPANADDKAWAQLYVQATSSASDVSTILG